MIAKEGIIVKTIKYQEASKIAYILSEDGLFSFLIRNSNNYKSKNFAYSQELTSIAFDYSSNNDPNKLKVLTSGKVLNNYNKIKGDPQKLFDCIEMCEIVYLLTNHTNDKKTLYSFFKSILEKIDNNKYNHYYNLIFKIKLTYLLGISFGFNNCGRCGKKEQLVGFDLENGNSVCKDCLYISDDVIFGKDYEILKLLYLVKLDLLNDEFLNNLSNNNLDSFLDKYYSKYLGYSSKSKKVINKLKNK